MSTEKFSVERSFAVNSGISASEFFLQFERLVRELWDVVKRVDDFEPDQRALASRALGYLGQPASHPSAVEPMGLVDDYVILERVRARIFPDSKPRIAVGNALQRLSCSTRDKLAEEESRILSSEGALPQEELEPRIWRALLLARAWSEAAEAVPAEPGSRVAPMWALLAGVSGAIDWVLMRLPPGMLLRLALLVVVGGGMVYSTFALMEKAIPGLRMRSAVVDLVKKLREGSTTSQTDEVTRKGMEGLRHFSKP
ncbi:MAG: hypothetical protein HYY25_12905 [Candidatus Wallbacteria bacterium]|nr:hypothetical protein [Candidatus Wallbacteria bacterium]